MIKTRAGDLVSPGNNPPKLGLSIGEFCEAYGISRGTFYNLEKIGKAPRTMQIGSRRIIAVDSLANWNRQREGEI